MKLLERADGLFMFSALYSLAMCLLTAFSIVATAEYVTHGTVTAYRGPGACMVMSFAVLIMLAAYSVPTALAVARAAGSRASLRAAYVYLLLPLVFLGLLVGNSANWFLNALAFGWPLFLVIAVAVPVASYTVKREAATLYRPVRCHTCHCAFYILFDAPSEVCPYCFFTNANPYLPDNRDDPRLALGGFAPGDPRQFGGPGTLPQADLRGTVAFFLIPASLISLVLGFILMPNAARWGDTVEVLVTAAIIVLGFFGLLAVYLAYTRRSNVVGLVVSALLVLEGIFLLLVWDFLGLAIGLLAACALVFSVRLAATRPRSRGRMVRVPKGAGPGEKGAHPPLP